MKAWPALAIGSIQCILVLAHWFVLATWIAFWPGLAASTTHALHAVMLVAAFSYASASLLAFRFANLAVRFVYGLASLWLGFFSYFFWASLAIWAAWLVLCIAHLSADPAVLRPALAGVFFAAATLTGLFGVVNAQILRVRCLTIALPHLPAAWQGRRAVVLSDLHLGAINGARFCRRVVSRAARLQPDLIFLPGDLFDGTKNHLDRMLAPFAALQPPLGIYFSTGNHEEFADPVHYLEAVRRAGIRVLGDELVAVDGMQIAGVFYHSSSSPLRMKAALDGMKLDRARPSILLNHAPTRLPTVEQAGFNLQISGHTHGGQFLPFTWLTRMVYGCFTHGLHRFGALQVCTSTGAGSWGPPMRVGTQQEIVLLTFAASDSVAP